MLNLDTHILIYALLGQLKPKEKNLLESKPWSISAIVLWELSKLTQLGRIRLDFDSINFRHMLNQVRVWPLSWEVCQAATKLDFKSDPADELIAATSLVHQIPLITRDRTLRNSRLVPLV